MAAGKPQPKPLIVDGAQGARRLVAPSRSPKCLVRVVTNRDHSS